MSSGRDDSRDLRQSFQDHFNSNTALPPAALPNLPSTQNVLAVNAVSSTMPTPCTTPPSSGIIVQENAVVQLDNTDVESVGSQHSIVRIYDGSWSLVCDEDNAKYDLTTLERYATLLTWRSLSEQELERLLDSAKNDLTEHEFSKLLQIVAIVRSSRLLADEASNMNHNSASSSHL